MMQEASELGSLFRDKLANAIASVDRWIGLPVWLMRTIWGLALKLLVDPGRNAGKHMWSVSR
jgi:hypothetical protein